MKARQESGHREVVPGRARRRRIVAPIAAALPIVGLGIGGALPAGASARPHAGGTINVGVIGPMTGPAAEIGTLMSAACASGIHVVNAAGGALGNKLSCDLIDDTGDPADAVPNVTRALATASNLKMAVGLESNTAATTIPLVNNAQIPMFSTNGLVAFDKTTDRYFWRTTPADNQNGAAFAVWAVKEGYKRAAMIFENNIGDQGNEPGVVQGIDHLGGKISINVTIPGDAASYSSVVERVIASHPQVLIAEADPQSAATFFSEYKQLNHGHVPPIVTGTDSLTPDYLSAMEKVLGKSYVTKDISLVGSHIDPGSVAYRAYKAALYASPTVKNPALVLGVGVISSIYDGIVAMSLAMDMAHSTTGSVYNADIEKVTSASRGAVVVHTYAQGFAALKRHKAIDYVGVEGQITFDKYHNSPGNFSASAFNADGSPRSLGVIAGSEVQKLLG
ncbi:MAG TPA: ABC transporter substrate-binding protein [Acidimicrobiales bacterium]|nr:ABC transporter substrate-binding protein [Acidimicrobiales bacterium]